MSDLVVVVTGGGRGIGRATCTRFAAAGCKVVAASRSHEDLEETCRLIRDNGGSCTPRATDVCNLDDVKGLIDSTVDRLGTIDVLVNCAGAVVQSPVEDLTSEMFDSILNVNIKGVYHCCHAVWPAMKASGGGVIINISSKASVDAFTGLAAYGAAKAWVNSWTRSLADEGSACGIRVFAVAPGAVETRMLRDAFPEFPKDQTLDPADVAGMVYTLAQPDCRHATGQTVFVRK